MAGPSRDGRPLATPQSRQATSRRTSRNDQQNESPISFHPPQSPARYHDGLARTGFVSAGNTLNHNHGYPSPMNQRPPQSQRRQEQQSIYSAGPSQAGNSIRPPSQDMLQRHGQHTHGSYQHQQHPYYQQNKPQTRPLTRNEISYLNRSIAILHSWDRLAMEALSSNESIPRTRQRISREINAIMSQIIPEPTAVPAAISPSPSSDRTYTYKAESLIDYARSISATPATPTTHSGGISVRLRVARESLSFAEYQRRAAKEDARREGRMSLPPSEQSASSLSYSPSAAAVKGHRASWTHNPVFADAVSPGGSSSAAGTMARPILSPKSRLPSAVSDGGRRISGSLSPSTSGRTPASLKGKGKAKNRRRSWLVDEDEEGGEEEDIVGQLSLE